jgi:anthranilate 1,2-dioxygenase small subunit
VSSRVRVPEATRRLVEDLIYDVARLIDDDRLEALPDYFLDESTYRIASRFNVDRGLPLAPINCTSRGMLVDRIESLRKANIFQKHHYRHLVSGITITAAEGDAMIVRSNYVLIRIMESGPSTLFSCGEYRDRIALRDGVAFFQERLVVFDSNSIETLLVIPI